LAGDLDGSFANHTEEENCFTTLRSTEVFQLITVRRNTLE